MKRVLLGSVLLAAVGLLGCRDNPIEPGEGVAKIVASPARVFIEQGGSENVVIQALDDQGNPLPDEVTVSTQPGAGVTVVRDEALRPTYAPDGTLVPLPEGTVSRFIVSATDFVKTSFVVSAGNQSLEIVVEVVPATLPATLSKTDLAWGDTITITAPAGTFFRDTSKVTFASGMAPIIVERAADGSYIRLIPGPNSRGAATVTSVGIASNPGLFFTVPTVAEVTSPSLADLGNALSTTTPALNQVITITAPAGVKFYPTASVYFLAPADVAKNIVIAADSSSISFTAPPNRRGAVTVTQVAPAKLPDLTHRQTLTTADTIQTPVVAAVPATFSTTTPTAGQVITVTAGTGFKFTRATEVVIGGTQAVTTGAAADSSTITVQASPGSSGAVQIRNAIAGGFAIAEILPLTVPTPITAATGAAPAVAGTDAFATAPTITLPVGVGNATGVVSGAPFVFDASGPFGGDAQLFKIVVPAGTAAERTYTYSVNPISNGADLGVYFYTAAFAPITTFAAGTFLDAHGGGATNPESGTITLAAGTYYAAVVYFQYAASPTPPDHYVLRIVK